ncbi:MAG: hypothetical protein BGO49_24830 [Planctomycetales bacterium 71-10]|nr:MAG: hypothetical protein BGO49_24830 [Planctomycetales bacterium 71-10]
MERGSAGGRETLRRYGSEHFRELGKRGFHSFTERYFAGDRQQAGDWLRAKAHEKELEGFVEREMERRLQNGEQSVCMELPCLSDPDDEPF